MQNRDAHEDLAVDDWLRSIGLCGRIAAFRDHGVTLDMLAELTEADLRELGLTIGERKCFLRALAQRSPGATPAPADADISTGERRPLTVMFVDLVGSTSLGERLDPEELLDVTARYREFCGAAIARYGGSVARFVGDGILAYFCYPVATEDDPERAVRAALDIVGGIVDLSTPAAEKLQVRIGLATGLAVVSDLDAGGLEERRGVTGSLPNQAARLQSLAQPNGTIVSESTHARVAAQFVCEEMGQVHLRGFDRTTRPARVIGMRPGHRMSTAAVSRQHLTRLHGREAEVEALRSEWRRVVAGVGRAVLVVGEAGIGKSRLIDHLVMHDLQEHVVVYRLATSPFRQDTPLGPVAQYVRMRAGLEDADHPEVALAKVKSFLMGEPEQRDRAAVIISDLVGIPADDASRAAMPPEQLRQATISTLNTQIVALAAEVPVCLVIEDVHWLDPTSREWLGQLIDQVGRHRIMVLLSGRDTAAVNWAKRPQATTLSLERVGREQVAGMIRDLLGERPLTDGLVDQVLAKTDGVPLFVEEVGRLLLERLTTQAHDGPHEDPAHAIPESLQEFLTARLDRAGPPKQVAQIAAVIGRSVRYDILAQVCAMERKKLDAALSVLVEAGIFERHTRSGDDIFTFSHALVQKAAYASLLRGRRRELHARIARILEDAGDGTATRNPEILALHLTEGGLAEDAVPYWMEAARRSLSRSALTEATRLLRRGLDALEKLPETAQVLRLRLQVSALLGPALIGLKGPIAAETVQLYTSAHEIALRMPQDASHFPLHWGWWRLSADGRDNVDRSAALLKIATGLRQPGLLLQAHHCCWGSHQLHGTFDKFFEHVSAGLAIYDQGDFTDQAGLYGNHDARVCAQGSQSKVCWMQGRFEEALRAEQDAMAWAQRLNHLGSRVHAMGLTLVHRAYRRDYEEVFKRSAELIDLTAAHGVAEHGAAGLIFSGWALGMKDDPASGLARMEEGFARQQDIATTEDFPFYLCALAEVLVRLGRPDEAAERIERRIGDFDRIGLGLWMPELLRVLADTTLLADPAATDRAQALLADAHSLATAQQVPMLDLRIALSRSRLCLRRGLRDDARNFLRIAINQLPQGESSEELTEAQALLSGLTPSACFGSHGADPIQSVF